MKTFDISVVISAVRPARWLDLYKQIVESVGPYTFELICVGPYFPPAELQSLFNFTFTRDFGSPSRCTQIGSILARGRYIAVFPDDCIVDQGTLAECIAYMDNKDRKDGMTIVYSEGINYGGVQHIQLEYWDAWHHSSLHCPLVKKEWKIAPNFIYRLDYYRELGGLDCRWEHANMNTHDLAFRVQRNGGTIHLSPRRVIRTNWVPWDNNNKVPTQLAFEENDLPLFQKVYSSAEYGPIIINYDNWRDSDPIWKRKFNSAS